MADLFDLAAKTDWADLMVLRWAGFRSVQSRRTIPAPQSTADAAEPCRRRNDSAHCQIPFGLMGV